MYYLLKTFLEWLDPRYRGQPSWRLLCLVVLVFHPMQNNNFRSHCSNAKGTASAPFPSPPGERGFADGRVHSFRHYFVSQAFLSGVGEGEIMTWVGHRDSKMVAHYRHLGNADARRKMNQIDFLGEGSASDGPIAQAS